MLQCACSPSTIQHMRKPSSGLHMPPNACCRHTESALPRGPPGPPSPLLLGASCPQPIGKMLYYWAGLSFLRPCGPHMGLISIPKGHKPLGAGLGCHWCMLLDEKLGSGSSIRVKGVDFQILAIRAALWLKQWPFQCLGGPMSFSQHLVAPGHALGSHLVLIVNIWPMLHTGVQPIHC